MSRILAFLRENSSVVIAVFTVVTVIVAWLQWRTMEASLQISNRAWVNVVLGKGNIRLGEKLQYPVLPLNDGKTPARKFDAKFRVEIVDWGKAPDFSYPEGFTVPANAETMPAGTASQQEIGVSLKQPVPNTTNSFEDAPFSEDLFKRYSAPKVWIAVIAEVEYNDVFNHHHIQHYCWSDASQAAAGMVNEGFRACLKYSDMDSN